jgi:transcriptional regulator with XRE-family HTH domain
MLVLQKKITYKNIVNYEVKTGFMNDDISNNNDKNLIGRSIRFWREIRGYKQEHIARKLGFVQSYVSSVESGRTGVSVDQLKKFAELLDVKVETLLLGLSPHQEIIEKIYNDSAYKVTPEELETLMSVRFRHKHPKKEFFLFILEQIRGGLFLFEKNEVRQQEKEKNNHGKT